MRLLIYALPALMDMVVAMTMFIVTVRLSKLGVSASVVAGSVTFESLIYMIACPLVGRFVTERNAARMLIAACTLFAILCGLFTVLSGVIGMYVLFGLVGVAAALFFPPFQVFMKAVDRSANRSIAWSTGIYTFAWSAGFAIGPFIAGFLMELGPPSLSGEPIGWKFAYAFASLAAVAAAAGIIALRHLAQASTNTTSTESRPAVATDLTGMPDLAWLGWLGGGVGMLIISIIRGVFPSHAVTDLHLADSVQGSIFFLLSITQAITGLLLVRSRRWMYQPLPVAAFGLIGLAGILLLGFTSSPLPLCLAGILFGVYSGGFFFYIVFHALAHPARSGHYVAINESVIGGGGILGPVIGGLLADRFGFGIACIAGTAILLAVTLYQAHIHHRRPAPDFLAPS